MTGGAGFVGAALVRSLVERGDNVTVLDSGSAAGFGNLDGVTARLVTGDIRDPKSVQQAILGCDYVIHLAAQPSVQASITSPLADHEVNVLGTLYLLEAARAAGVRRVVFGSSNAVIAGHPPPASEQLTPRPVAPYGAAKAAVEGYLVAYHRSYGIETVALRFANAYGRWSTHKTSVVPSFVRAFLAGSPITLSGDGRQTRDFVHVSDIARLLVQCLDAPPEVVAGEVFQAGTGRETSLLELIEVLFEVGGSEVPIERTAPSPGDVARNVSDVSKAESVLGFRAQVELAAGLSDTLAWFRRQSENHSRGM